MPNEQQQLYRNAMAQLAGAVNVVTSRGEGGTCGLTATAVCSVSDSPATVLVCINRDSAVNAVIRGNGRLCVNVCSADQQEISCHFAGMTELTMEQRFELDAWDQGVLEQPLLRGALANLEGRITDIAEVGSHSVFYVEVDNIRVNDGQDALLYFNRAFRTLSANG
ncbi:MAG: 4-hydroxyphenylacetate 3-monooxygenase, reductase component [Oceanospirillaceae bacterium]|jgi:flavin reductase (NADH)|uniref:4-hydroxyphenylacetate 3-monooxygenase, reductase component n=1 Tax=Marinobacterium litorale TaxID=404770 RepID=UPI0004284D6F|nr:4-hydroxyphenylacetate 3-monooxygenase, reductase component [Marinobacterium litorale]MBT00193.1 4-hydroxyphenylacetate 3-monooxygenase, reductase component [Oceanospirillaceae bacterium]